MGSKCGGGGYVRVRGVGGAGYYTPARGGEAALTTQLIFTQLEEATTKFGPTVVQKGPKVVKKGPKVVQNGPKLSQMDNLPADLRPTRRGSNKSLACGKPLRLERWLIRKALNS